MKAPPLAAGLCPSTGKWRFETETDAQETLLAARASHNAKGQRQEVRVYGCPWCRGWHLTSKAEGDLRRRLKRRRLPRP